MRRRLSVLVGAALVVAAVFALAGVALTDNIEGDGGDDRLVGTSRQDAISGAGDDDDVFGKAERDRLSGDSGSDEIHGNGGPDRLFGDTGSDFHNVFDEQANDFVNCGRGRDDVAIGDILLPSGQRTDTFVNCETVYFAIPICGVTCREAKGSGIDLSRLGPRDLKQAVEDGLVKKIEP